MSGIWTEHRNPEGRTYWFNTGTKESVWEKPDVLKTPFEKALGETKWKEYFSGGRKYYYNTESKESKWDMPDELLTLLEKVEKEQKASQQMSNPHLIAPAFTPGSKGASVHLGGADPSLLPNQQPLNGIPNPLALVPASSSVPVTPTPSSLPARMSLPDDPVIPHNGFTTTEEAEKAFMHLLRKAGVDATWTWDQTMRAIITDPLYKALNTLAEKKVCWQRYVETLVEKEREEREARLAKIRPALRNMLKGNPSVFHYTTFATADKLFAQHPIWQQAKIEAERKMIFEEYVSELKQREVQESRAAHARSVSKVVALFKEMNIDVLTRWRQAHSAVIESEAYANDSELQNLPSLDVLLAFEDYARVQEREFDTRMRRETIEKTRRERKAREGFKQLLQELKDAGHIKARTKWKEVYPRFEEDERYLNLLGKPGSNPLELFWDVVDSLDQRFDIKLAMVEDAFKKAAQKGEEGLAFEVKHDTVQDEFLRLVTMAQKSHEDLQSLNEEDLQEIFQFLHAEAIKKQETEKRRSERKQRHMQDDLRYALKKLSEPIDGGMSYEDAVPLMEHLPEYKALEDEGRRLAFDKFIKRQKERMRERDARSDDGSTTSRKRKEPAKDGERDRDRGKDREREDGRSSRHHRKHDDEYDSRREREREREHRDRDKERERERDVEKDGHSSSRRKDYDREGDRSRSERNRHRSRSRGTRGDELNYESSEKREREDRSVSDRSEKRARYTSVDTGGREDTPEEGEI